VHERSVLIRVVFVLGRCPRSVTMAEDAAPVAVLRRSSRPPCSRGARSSSFSSLRSGSGLRVSARRLRSGVGGGVGGDGDGESNGGHTVAARMPRWRIGSCTSTSIDVTAPALPFPRPPLPAHDHLRPHARLRILFVSPGCATRWRARSGDR